MLDKGVCILHGEFILQDGCPQCLKERWEMVEITAMGDKQQTFVPGKQSPSEAAKEE